MNEKQLMKILIRKNPLIKKAFAKGFIKQPKCLICGKPMINVVDSRTKDVSPYLWKTTYGYAKNLTMSIG